MEMMITQRIANLAKQSSDGLVVKNLCLGLGYTGVLLSNNEAGCCFTFRSELGPGNGVMKNAGSLIGMPVSEAIDMAMSTNLAEASTAIAAINAVLNAGYEESANALSIIDLQPGDKVGMIGNFMPIKTWFAGKSPDQLYIFERNLTEDGLLPDWAEDIYLPQCDVVVITGVTFANKTIDHILRLSENAKEVVIMGPSTCMAPEILKEYGVTVIAGSRISGQKAFFSVIAQGGGGESIRPHTSMLCERICGRRS
ncbi:MAG: DUF364 domain-containing protein [Eubacteriaceae bacterium]|nr:DUF364 domain-containing protein [Eubacteriaceae bacterium]